MKHPTLALSVGMHLPTEPPTPFTLGPRIWELEPHHCRWIEDGVDGLNTLYCGHPKRRGSNYCTEHHQRAYSRIKI